MGYFVQLLEIDPESLESLFQVIGIFLLIGLVWVIAEYVIRALVLNGIHKLTYGKGNILVWIPIANIYMLGKLTVNEIFGIVLLMANFLINFVLPEDISNSLSSTYNSITFCLFIYAIIKYFKLKNQVNSNSQHLDSYINSNYQANVQQGQYYQQQPSQYNSNGIPVSQQTDSAFNISGANVQQGLSFDQQGQNSNLNYNRSNDLNNNGM